VNGVEGGLLGDNITNILLIVIEGIILILIKCM